MVQIVLPNGGITTLEEHEVLSFPNEGGDPMPVVPSGADPASVDPYLLAVKLDEPPGTQ